MCLVSAPKVQSTSDADKPVPVLRNPFLDGVAPLIRAQTTGLSSLRINRTAPLPAAAPTSPLAISRTPSPVVTTSAA